MQRLARNRAACAPPREIFLSQPARVVPSFLADVFADLLRGFSLTSGLPILFFAAVGRFYTPQCYNQGREKGARGIYISIFLFHITNFFSELENSPYRFLSLSLSLFELSRKDRATFNRDFKFRRNDRSPLSWRLLYKYFITMRKLA